MTRHICFKIRIYLTTLHSIVSFARKRFIGIRRTAVEKIVIAERRKLHYSELLCSEGLESTQVLEQSIGPNLKDLEPNHV